MKNIGETINEYLKVLRMARKPDRDEFLSTTKIAVAVMFVVGFIGFLIYILMEILPGALK
uniref:Protein translocase subunit SecE n=1 Tax=Geoglobus ahangari TaxID=113653 RepID=A0A7C4S704_9EURY